LNGTTLGILHRRWQLCPADPGGVSADQYNAAQAYIATVFHHAEVMGLPMPWPGGAASRPTRGDPAEDVVLALRRPFPHLRPLLAAPRRPRPDAGRERGRGAGRSAGVSRIGSGAPPLAAVEPAEIESLRYGLNAIARWLR